jgi:hypothetical protein
VQVLLVSLRRDYSSQFGKVDNTLMNLGLAYRWPRGTGAELHYECLYAVSGGTVGATGDMPQSQLSHGHKCKEVFEWYFSNVRSLTIDEGAKQLVQPSRLPYLAKCVFR